VVPALLPSDPPPEDELPQAKAVTAKKAKTPTDPSFECRLIPRTSFVKLPSEYLTFRRGQKPGPRIPTLKAQYPLFKALVWFDINKETDWRINSSSAALTAFSKMAQDPYFNP